MTIKDTPEEWEIRGTRTPFVGNKTSVRTDEVVMPDGSVVHRDYQVHPGSVAVLALDDEDRVLLIRQYRHPVRQKLWEIPAGLLDVPGENPLHAAQRELYEEAHVKAEDWRVLTDVYTSPGAPTRRSGSSWRGGCPRPTVSASRSSTRRSTWSTRACPCRSWCGGCWRGSCTTTAWWWACWRWSPRGPPVGWTGCVLLRRSGLRGRLRRDGFSGCAAVVAVRGGMRVRGG